MVGWYLNMIPIKLCMLSPCGGCYVYRLSLKSESVTDRCLFSSSLEFDVLVEEVVILFVEFRYLLLGVPFVHYLLYGAKDGVS